MVELVFALTLDNVVIAGLGVQGRKLTQDQEAAYRCTRKLEFISSLLPRLEDDKFFLMFSWPPGLSIVRAELLI